MKKNNNGFKLLYGMKIDTDPKKIEEFLTRGVENIFPNKEFVKKQLLSGKKLRMYMGVDPTGRTLHMGHAVILKKLGEFQKLGHQIIFLIGDFTAMIGDPTDKGAARKQLTRKEVLNNCKLYKKQASKFIKFGLGEAEFKFNSKWLAKMNFEKVLDLSSKITVDQLMKRDMFQKRAAEGKPIYLHEFMYPLMQGYDSIVLDVDGEVGGNDQMFNMLVGRDLIKEVKNKEKFVITMKILEDSNGKKMGKTDGNAVSMLDNEFEMYGKVMSWTDDMMLRAFEISTYLPSEEIEKIKEQLGKGTNPREIKGILAREIVKVYHGEAKAQKAEENFIATFKKGGIPEDVQEIKIEKGSALSSAVVSNKIVPSNTEFRRLITAGAISDMKTGEKITDPNFKIESEIVLKIGKKTFVKIVV